ISAHIDELKKQLQEYNDVDIVTSKMTIDEIQAKIVDVKTEIVSLEPVNMLAIEEYERERKRYEERYQHVKQLEDERKEIIALIKDLEKKRNEKFMKIYKSIKKKFREIYKTLSGGGSVDLVLENERDPLSGGILLYASPPGKKRTRVETLSGGERSLVALSLILAIQEVIPSPFYVFDEVDMFLDAVNAENVGKLIKEKSTNSQFIVISLRKSTIKYAEAIIGVTQPKKAGISKIMPFIGVTDDIPVGENKGIS
ncbi:MAG TPA: chromosome segregation protein SMC, partial [Euryarchaeota archaeon]|nr:chromosome segregation protein SMC [Euryarchaeota archaeon]